MFQPFYLKDNGLDPLTVLISICSGDGDDADNVDRWIVNAQTQHRPRAAWLVSVFSIWIVWPISLFVNKVILCYSLFLDFDMNLVV